MSDRKSCAQSSNCSLRKFFASSCMRLILRSFFIDETSFNIWQSPSRIWLKEGMLVELPNSRGPSITMIGAISTHRGLFHTYTFAATNNQDTFIPFILKLREKCRGH